MIIGALPRRTWRPDPAVIASGADHDATVRVSDCLRLWPSPAVGSTAARLPTIP